LQFIQAEKAVLEEEMDELQHQLSSIKETTKNLQVSYLLLFLLILWLYFFIHQYLQVANDESKKCLDEKDKIIAQLQTQNKEVRTLSCSEK
jgi:hypothetical protein